MATYVFGDVERRRDSRGREQWVPKKTAASYDDIVRDNTMSRQDRIDDLNRRFSSRGITVSDGPVGSDEGPRVTIGGRTFSGTDAVSRASFFARQTAKENKEAADVSARARDMVAAAKRVGVDVSAVHKEWRADAVKAIREGTSHDTFLDRLRGQMQTAASKRFEELSKSYDPNGGNYDTFKAEQAKRHEKAWRGSGDRPVDTAPSANPVQTPASGNAKATAAQPVQQPRTVRSPVGNGPAADRDALDRAGYLMSGQGQADYWNSRVGSMIGHIQAQQSRRVASQLEALLRDARKYGYDLNGGKR